MKANVSENVLSEANFDSNLESNFDVHCYCKQWGDRSFAVAGPKSWNTLPSDPRTTTDPTQFKAKLKTYLFKLAFH